MTASALPQEPHRFENDEPVIFQLIDQRQRGLDWQRGAVVLDYGGLTITVRSEASGEIHRLRPGRVFGKSTFRFGSENDLYEWMRNANASMALHRAA